MYKVNAHTHQTSELRKKKKKLYCDFNRGIVVGARRGGLRGFAYKTLEFIQNGMKNKKAYSKQQFSLVGERRPLYNGGEQKSSSTVLLTNLQKLCCAIMSTWAKSMEWNVSNIL